jgi:hypothetical protein
MKEAGQSSFVIRISKPKHRHDHGSVKTNRSFFSQVKFRPVSLLGEIKRWTQDMVINLVC